MLLCCGQPNRSSRSRPRHPPAFEPKIAAFVATAVVGWASAVAAVEGGGAGNLADSVEAGAETEDATLVDCLAEPPRSQRGHLQEPPGAEIRGQPHRALGYLGWCSSWVAGINYLWGPA